LFEIAKHINIERNKNSSHASALSKLLRKLGNYLGILQLSTEDYFKQGVSISDAEIEQKINKRNEARATKDFSISDQIRDELLALDVVLEDNENGTTWRRK
jgi:cysteinyl-tRNA synthetase